MKTKELYILITNLMKTKELLEKLNTISDEKNIIWINWEIICYEYHYDMEMDEASKEHITKQIDEWYKRWELLYEDEEKGIYTRWWWEIIS